MINSSEQDKSELSSQTLLAGGKYIIEKKIGAGGFGITYRAIQQGLNKIVCIKEFFLSGKCVRSTHSNTIFLQSVSEDVYNKYRAAFVREARLLAELKHSNIIEVIDVFDENNTSYMVMPYIEGDTLQKIVEQKGPIIYEDAVNYMAQISDGVGYIHNKNILHRDIKPDNIMITAEHKAILIDFGSAREFEHDKTQIHTSILTHGYAPTEQYTKNSRKGAYTDIYAIGATLYYILTGVVPIEAAARLTEKMPEPKTLNSNIPEEANRTILKAMQLKSENRHQRISDFMDDLLNVNPSELIDETLQEKVVYIEKSNLWMIKWGILAFGLLLAIAIGIYIGIRPSETFVANSDIVDNETIDFTGMDYPMVNVDGGSFIMGSEQSVNEDENYIPHEVYLNSFYIGKYEVSQGLWRKIMGENPSEYQPQIGPNQKSLTQEQKDRFPVENVSYDDIVLFIEKLNKKTGYKFTLPTEAQWEYAARGGQKSKNGRFANGKNIPKGIWFDKEHAIPVDYADISNELGILHMSGNVAEWCCDYYDGSFYEMSPRENPINRHPVIDDLRVVRGGSFNETKASINNLLVFSRSASDEASSEIGFRLVLEK